MRSVLFRVLALSACFLFCTHAAAKPADTQSENAWFGADIEPRWFGAAGVTRYGRRVLWHASWLDWGVTAAGETAHPASPKGIVAACGGDLGHSWFRIEPRRWLFLLHSRASVGALGLEPGDSVRESELPRLSPYVGFSTLLRLALNVHPGLNVTVDNELSLQMPLGPKGAWAALDRVFVGSALRFTSGAL